ncbi:hypothetical protein HAZT_HAZT003008 [Hyalella azteca]|uniref:Mos1 transposase HTH domain-containing protein n=1 Tax=Hyalella azteca TaxID=294128 RepID=A0A6A0GV07_HYAAZ|nr:hypothetical protein HAZT_HAZT003008 [Hyalella azteca]
MAPLLCFASVDSSDEEEDPELQLLESGKHDIICLESKTVAGGQGPMRSRKHHHMFPYHEEKMLQEAFKNDCISRSQSGKWHKAFKEGREKVAYEPRSGRPTTAQTEENVDRVREVLRSKL